LGSKLKIENNLNKQEYNMESSSSRRLTFCPLTFYTIRAELWAFWSFSRIFLTLEILNQQNVKLFT